MKKISYIILAIFLFHSSGCAYFTYTRSLHKEKLYKLENNFAVKCIRLNLWNEAKYHLERAYELNPNSPSINNNLAVVYEYFNNIDKSKFFYQNAVKLSSNKIYRNNFNLFLKEYNVSKPDTSNQIILENIHE
ncbi:MAG: hypothetical protein QMD92_05365 [bacterium]|nr:hypothetical protein [bacterium]